MKDKRSIDRRSEPRKIVDQYYSVEFSLDGLESLYQFKIWDVSSMGMCVLVKEDSAVVGHLKVGEQLDTKYYSTDSANPIEFLKSEIRHITKAGQGRFKGHYLVGLAILEKQQLK